MGRRITFCRSLGTAVACLDMCRRHTFLGALLAAVVGFGLVGAGPAPAADGDACAAPATHGSFGRVQVCPLWMPSRAYVPVDSLAGGVVREVGRLTRAGRANWFVCQTAAPGGRTVRYRDARHPQYTNVWWARTLSDTGAWGWVSEVYFSGGADDERDAGLRTCSSSEAAVTGAGGPPAAGPQPVAPAPVAPKPRPAAASGVVVDGSFDCRRGRTSERALVRYRLTHRILNYTGNWTNGAPEIHQQLRQEFALGEVAVRVSTCLTRRGWRILGGGAIESESTGLDREGMPRGNDVREKGWGVAVRGGRAGRLDVIVPRCRLRGT